MVDGKAAPVTVEEYKQQLAARLVEEAPTLDTFRSRWIVPPERRELLGRLPDAGRSAFLVRALEEMTEYDLYDVLAELGYGLAPRTREGRAEAFLYKHADWLSTLPRGTTATLKALAEQFATCRDRRPGESAGLPDARGRPGGRAGGTAGLGQAC